MSVQYHSKALSHWLLVHCLDLTCSILIALCMTTQVTELLELKYQPDFIATVPLKGNVTLAHILRVSKIICIYMIKQ